MIEKSHTEHLEESLGYCFRRREFLELALTHRSWIEEQYPGGTAPSHASQQRLEFLGDALLNYVIGRWLYDLFPEAGEGELTERRKAFTRGEWLRARGAALGLDRVARLGRGESQNALSNRKLLEDTTEALLGAIALDGGDEAAVAVIRSWLPSKAPPPPAPDPIVAFNEWFQANKKCSPLQPDYAEEGPHHQRTWTARLKLDEIVKVGRGTTKKLANSDACRLLMEELTARGLA